MLPDVPTLKSEFQLLINKYISEQARRMLGIFRDIPKHYVHEGSAMKTVRADGSLDESEFATASAEVSIDARSTSTLSPEQRIAYMDDMAEQLASQMSKHLYGVLEATVQKTGQIVDAKQSFGPHSIFEMFEKIEMDFREDGTTPQLSMAFGSEALKKFIAAKREIEENPVLNEEFDQLLQKKQEQWRDREAARKLVG